MDRFTNWPDLWQGSKTIGDTSAASLVKALCYLFGKFGVPEEHSIDGGPEYVARETPDLLKT
jgi:hypothetical protein